MFHEVAGPTSTHSGEGKMKEEGVGPDSKSPYQRCPCKPQGATSVLLGVCSLGASPFTSLPLISVLRGARPPVMGYRVRSL